ncbi:MAG TPA: hypothetical protein VIW64_09360 [Pyrinomonadaceae bacterium]|jgi:hypothetical protein
MTDLEIQVAMGAIAEALVDRGKDPDEIRKYLREEADRVAQEIEDEGMNLSFTR